MAFLIHLCVLFPSQHQKLMQFTTITTEYKFFFIKKQHIETEADDNEFRVTILKYMYIVCTACMLHTSEL